MVAEACAPWHAQTMLNAASTVRQRRIALAFAQVTAMWAACSAFAQAMDIQQSQASFVEGEYRFELTALIDAPVAEVESVLRDYEGYTALDSRILEARVVERPSEHSALLATTLRACFCPICRTVKRLERVDESPGALSAFTDPQHSDMQFGETRMQVDAVEDGRTRVNYQTRLIPDFWIPALVARRLMLETLEDATLDLFRNVERMAQTGQVNATK